jgi:hypothetical protein
MMRRISKPLDLVCTYFNIIDVLIVNLIKKAELVSDVVSLASGQLPISLAFRFVPIFFRRRKKGLSKAQMKKMMMRRRRMFVDTVIVQHKRIHDKNREKVIEETKARLASKLKPQSKPNKSDVVKNILNRAPNRNDNSKFQSRTKPQDPSKTRIQGLIDNERQKSRSKWAVRVEKGGSAQEV